jgi:hypothetical protein
MKRCVGIVIALTLVGAVDRASAGGVSLAWDNCLPEGGQALKTFACNSNTGSATMWGSFRLSSPQPNFVGVEASVEVQTASGALPDWWQLFNVGACRQTALAATFDFTEAIATLCTDPWQGGAQGGLAAYQTSATVPADPSGLPNRARVKIAAAIPIGSPVSLDANREYYAFKLRVGYAKTTGAGACAGCATTACFVLRDLVAAQSDGSKEYLSDPLGVASVRWQSIASECPSVVQPLMFGTIKSFYR